MDSELRQLQLKCLEILDIAISICQKYDIKYSLCGGSVVGAHLYNGILPWDDDIDLMMTRENYNRFLQVAEQELPEGFSIANFQNSDLSNELRFCWTKIINENTTLVQTNGKVEGVFLDIAVFDRVPEGILKHVDLFLYKRAQMVNTGKLPNKSVKNRIRNFIIDTFFSDRRKYLMFTQKMIELIAKTSSNYTYRELFSVYYYVNMIPYRASVFEHYTTIEFEGRKVMIIRDYIEYLQTRYKRADFHEPKEKQIPLHYAYVDFNLPYKEYIRKKEQEKGHEI
jgi:lipopolysaccharide cholinephosphotransferase